jgi:hypothetical protein
MASDYQVFWAIFRYKGAGQETPLRSILPLMCPHFAIPVATVLSK